MFPVVDLWDIVQLPDGREVATIISQEDRVWCWRVVRYMPQHVADDWTVLGYGPAVSEVRAKEMAADFREILHLIGGVA